jgi:oligoendopeptidase F
MHDHPLRSARGGIPRHSPEAGRSSPPGGELSEARQRSQVPERFTWDTAELFASAEAWGEARSAIRKRVPSLEAFRGTLCSSSATLLRALTEMAEVSRAVARLYVYASAISDVDTRKSTALARVQELLQLSTDINGATSYVQPEILAAGADRVEELIREEPALEVHRHDLDDILRRKEHTGSPGEERIIADAGLMGDTPESLYGVFTDADFPYPDVTLSSGRMVRLDKAAFSLFRAVPEREDRREVFRSFFGALRRFRRTFGGQLYAQVKRDMFYARARRYGSSLDAALDGGNIPGEVYTGLVANVNRNLNSLHRALRLRQELLGVDRLHYYDLYAPLVPRKDLHYSYEHAQELILASLAPLGQEYTTVVRRAFTERWLDVFPSAGKRSGAYSNGGAYDVHPYILLNYNGKLDDVSTLAHELGHTMHSHLTNSTQPYVLSHYSIFVAEVASTFNEALLFDHMARTATDQAERLMILGQYLDGLRATVFRQTQFAEFELRIHEMAERGETLTGDLLSEAYLEITRRYYGHDQGVCTVDEEIADEWAAVPHFFYTFYVYQYATSFTASAALSERLLEGEPGTRERYLQLLSAGGADYPMALLREAGVDMTTGEPLELTMRKMNRVITEMESLARRMKA